MTDTTRDLLISLASHMAYMQGQLEAHHEHDDPEDYYWYRESVLLRQKVTDVLADGPAVPEGREPAAVTGQPSDQELLDIAASTIEPYERSGIATDEYEPETESAVEAYGSELIAYARAVLARWGNLKGSLTRSPPADGEVKELVAEIRRFLAGYRQMRGLDPEYIYSIHRGHVMEAHITVSRLTRAAELLEQRYPTPVPVSERPWEREGWCDWEGRCWWGRGESDDWSTDWTLATPEAVAEFCEFSPQTVCLPAHALPLPEVNNG